MSSAQSFDVIVIGAGPGGTAAAVRCAQLGGKVLLIEKDRLGGTCLNRGCIPTKTLLQSARAYRIAQKIGQFGITVENVAYDLPLIQKRKTRVIKQLRAGVEQLVDSYHIARIAGSASFTSKNTVNVEQSDGSKDTYTARYFIIATGSSPCTAPFAHKDTPLLSTDEALDLATLPSTIAIIGAGAVGLELASFFVLMGVPVTLIEMLPGLLPGLDHEIADQLTKDCERKGITLMFSSKVTGWDGKKLIVENKNRQRTELPVKAVVWAGGRKAVITGLGLDKASVACGAQGITVDAEMRTAQKHIFAIGDAAGKYQLAYTASAEGVVAAENCFGKNKQMSYTGVPFAVFTEPPVAWVGSSEDQAIEQEGKGNVRTGRFPLLANSRATILAERVGLVKVVARTDGTVLGVHMIGQEASELIPIAAMAVKEGMHIDRWKRECFTHPSIVESIFMAGEDCFGRCVDLPKK